MRLPSFFPMSLSLIALCGPSVAGAKCVPYTSVEIKGTAPSEGQVCVQFESMSQGSCAAVEPDGTWSTVIYYRVYGGWPFGHRCGQPVLKTFWLSQVDDRQVRVTPFRVRGRDIDYSGPHKLITVPDGVLEELEELPGPSRP